MSFNQFLCGVKLATCVTFWVFLFFGTVISVVAANGIVDKTLNLCIAIFFYVITIIYRNNRYVFALMAASVVIVMVLLYAASRSSKKR